MKQNSGAAAELGKFSRCISTDRSFTWTGSVFWLFLLALTFEYAAGMVQPVQAGDGLSKNARESDVIVLKDPKRAYPLGPHFYVFEDHSDHLTVNQIASDSISKQFGAVTSPIPSISSTKSAIWVRFTVEDSSSEYSFWLLEVGYAMLDEVRLYSGSPAAGFTETVSRSSTPVQERTIRHRLLYFRLPPQKNVPQQFYLRITARTSIPLALTIRHVREFMDYDHNAQMVLGIFYGAMLIMILYNLFLFLSVRDKTYLYYVLYVSGYTVYQLAQDGLVKEYIITSGDIFFYVAYGAIGFFLFFGVQFTRTYLSTKQRTKPLDRVLFLIGGGALVSFLFSPVLAGGPLNLIAGILAIGYGITGFSAAILCRRQGFRPAGYYMIALSGFFLGFVIRVARVEGLVPMNFFTQNAFQMGVLWEISMLSLALGNRINTLKAEYDHERQMTRHRISSDLHDEIGSNLSSIAVASQMLKSGPHLNSEQREELNGITSAAQRTAEAMREIVWFINPEHDTPREVVTKIRETAASLLRDVDLHFELDEKAIQIIKDLQVRRSIFLILKESLNNIARHAHATSVTVILGKEKNAFYLCVKDDGVGFTEKSIKPGDGLRNIRNRAQQMGGRLEIKSNPESGTEICFFYGIP